MKMIKKRFLAALLTMAFMISMIMIPDLTSEAAGGKLIPDFKTLESSVSDKAVVPIFYQPGSYSEVRIMTVLQSPNGQKQEKTYNVSTEPDIYTYQLQAFSAGTFKVLFKEQYWSGSAWVDSGLNATVSIRVGARKSAGWNKTDGKWCYYNSSGQRMRDWQQISGKWYYLNDFYGYITTGWKAIENKWYYFNKSGAAAIGWKKLGSTWYYFNKNCSMATGWKEIDKKWYYFGSDGAMKSKWQKIDNKWYYLNGGAMVKGWKQIDKKWYYFQKNGTCVMDKTIKIDGKSYTFNKKGVWVKK